MNESEVSRYRTLLTGKREEIAGKSRSREDIWIVQSNEQIETVQLAGEREFAVRTLERETKLLAQVEAALRRIDDGEYGICLECEEPISLKRLAAVPWALYCLHCQESRDTRDSSHVDRRLAA
jgi:DnaK suppressor protein